MAFPEFLQNLIPASLLQWLAAVLAIPAAVGGGIAAWRKLRASRLSRPVAFELPPIPLPIEIYADKVEKISELMVGRDADVNHFVDLVKDRPLVFLRGASGAGKSTFLKLGLGRELYHSGQWLPIYVDSWRSDWQEGPWLALADATTLAIGKLAQEQQKYMLALMEKGAPSQMPEGKEPDQAGNPLHDHRDLFRLLGQIRAATGRRPVVLFDQIDNYVDRYESLLAIAETRASLDPEELCSRNRFWNELRKLLRNDLDPVHAVIAARSDSPRVECFQFAKFHSRPLLNIPESAARELIRTLSADAVSNPENGFELLSERITERLSERSRGVLAVELRVALAGLASSHVPLTIRQLDKIGGVDGLAGRWLRDQIRDAQLNERDVLALLLRMVNRESRQTNPQLISSLSFNGDLTVCLNLLEERRVVRGRFEGTEDEDWQLYHSYLAGAVLSLESDLDELRLRVEREHRRFQDAPVLQKPLHLLSPACQIRLWWNVLRNQLRLGQLRMFARVSLLRLVVNSLTVTGIALALGWNWYSDEQVTQRLLGEFEGQERAKVFWALTTSDPSVTERFVIRGIDERRPTTRSMLNDDRSTIIQVLGPRPKGREVAADLVRGSAVCKQEPTAALCAELVQYVDRPSITRVAAESLFEEGEGLSLKSISAGLDPGDAAHIVEHGLSVLLVLPADKDASKYASRVDALTPLIGRLDPRQAAKLATRVFELIQKAETVPEIKGILTNILGDVIDRLDGQPAADLGASLLKRIAENPKKPESGESIPLLTRIALRLNPQQAVDFGKRLFQARKQDRTAEDIGRWNDPVTASTKRATGANLDDLAETFVTAWTENTAGHWTLHFAEPDSDDSPFSLMDPVARNSLWREFAKGVSEGERKRIADILLRDLKLPESENSQVTADAFVAFADQDQLLDGWRFLLMQGQERPESPELVWMAQAARSGVAQTMAQEILTQLKSPKQAKPPELVEMFAELAPNVSREIVLEGGELLLSRWRPPGPHDIPDIGKGLLNYVREIGVAAKGNVARALADGLWARIPQGRGAYIPRDSQSIWIDLTIAAGPEQAQKGAEKVLAGWDPQKGWSSNDLKRLFEATRPDAAGNLAKLIGVILSDKNKYRENRSLADCLQQLAPRLDSEIAAELLREFGLTQGISDYDSLAFLRNALLDLCRRLNPAEAKLIAENNRLTDLSIREDQVTFRLEMLEAIAGTIESETARQSLKALLEASQNRKKAIHDWDVAALALAKRATESGSHEDLAQIAAGQVRARAIDEALLMELTAESDKPAQANAQLAMETWQEEHSNSAPPWLGRALLLAGPTFVKQHAEAIARKLQEGKSVDPQGDVTFLRLTAGAEQVPLMIELLKWAPDPQSEIFQTILTLRKLPPATYGHPSETGNGFIPNLWVFDTWARQQGFDMNRPPRVSEAVFEKLRM